MIEISFCWLISPAATMVFSLALFLSLSLAPHTIYTRNWSNCSQLQLHAFKDITLLHKYPLTKTNGVRAPSHTATNKLVLIIIIIPINCQRRFIRLSMAVCAVNLFGCFFVARSIALCIFVNGRMKGNRRSFHSRSIEPNELNKTGNISELCTMVF